MSFFMYSMSLGYLQKFRLATYCITNLFMEEFEEMTLNSTPNPPKFWGRYVDDTGLVLPQVGDISK